MPIYEYRCPACERRFEKLMRMSAPAPACPDCGHVEVVKLVSGAGFILKGGGWYKDHYGLKKPAGGDDSAAAPSGDTGSSDSGGAAAGATTPTKAADDP